MTVGDRTYKGLAVPLNGEVQLKQDTAATDFVTLTGDSSISGDYLVCRVATSEVAYVNSAGKLYGTKLGVDGNVVLGVPTTTTTVARLKFSTPYTTGTGAGTTTGLSLGDLVAVVTSTTPWLGIAVNGASTATVVRWRIADTQTFGRATSP